MKARREYDRGFVSRRLLKFAKNPTIDFGFVEYGEVR
jgi:hypothetical protein